MSTASLDTNVILRLLLKDVPGQHIQAAELISRPGRFAIADTAVIEAVFVLARNYQIPREEIAGAVLEFLRDERYDCNRPLYAKAFPIFTARPSLSFEDCCLAAYAELNGALPLYTFDKDLARQMVQAELVG